MSLEEAASVNHDESSKDYAGLGGGCLQQRPRLIRSVPYSGIRDRLVESGANSDPSSGGRLMEVS